MMHRNINLVLSGSGTLYPIHAGAVIALLECGYKIDKICGVSGGAIIGAAYASGYNTPAKLKELIISIPPIIDLSFFSLLKYGLVKGDKIKKQFDERFVKNLGDTQIPLTIISSNLSKRKREIYDTRTTPKESLSEVVRCSMSYPGIFEYYKKNNDIHVDGGLYSNFPIDIFGNDPNTFGIQIGSASIHPINNIFEYISALVEALVCKSELEDIEDAQDAKIFNIRTSESVMNLKMDSKKISKLIDIGHYEMIRLLGEKKLL